MTVLKGLALIAEIQIATQIKSTAQTAANFFTMFAAAMMIVRPAGLTMEPMIVSAHRAERKHLFIRQAIYPRLTTGHKKTIRKSLITSKIDLQPSAYRTSARVAQSLLLERD